MDKMDKMKTWSASVSRLIDARQSKRTEREAASARLARTMDRMGLEAAARGLTDADPDALPSGER